MLEKLIIRLEKLQTQWDRKLARRRHERALRCAKTEITRLARMRVI